MKAWFLFLMIMGISCSDPQELASLGIKATDTIPLLDSAGSQPATLFLRGAPASTTGTSFTQTTGVPFDAEIDLSRSAQANAAIQWGLPDAITITIVFTNTQRQNFVFVVNPPIPKGPTLTRVTQTQPLPLAVEDIALIVLKVDGKEVAFHPPKK